MSMNERRKNLTGAELRAKSFLEGSNNFPAVSADLRVGQRCFAALERNAHEQRIFSRGNIFAAEKIGRFDAADLANAERANGANNIGEMSTIGKQQGEIALDARESRQRLVPSRFFRLMHRSINRIEFQLREENVLPQFQFFRDAARELPRETDRKF